MTAGVPVALLTPVPIDHLVDGVEVCRREGKVAYGSQAWETLMKFEDLGGVGAPVLVYASHNPEHLGPTVLWVGYYLDYVESKGGAHPAHGRYRPPSCKEEDQSGYWAGFYELSDLQQLDPESRIAIPSLRSLDGKPYAAGFVPEGPTIVTRPAGLPS